MKKIPKIKKKPRVNRSAAETIPVCSKTVNELHATCIPNLRSVLRNMVAGIDLADKYGEQRPVLPDNIEIKQVIVKPRPYLRNNYQ